MSWRCIKMVSTIRDDQRKLSNTQHWQNELTTSTNIKRKPTANFQCHCHSIRRCVVYPVPNCQCVPLPLISIQQNSPLLQDRMIDPNDHHGFIVKKKEEKAIKTAMTRMLEWECLCYSARLWRRQYRFLEQCSRNDCTWWIQWILQAHLLS
jgi:hypothetical protein